MNWKAFVASPWFGTGVIVAIIATIQYAVIQRHATKLLQFEGTYLHQSFKALLDERQARAKGQVSMLAKDQNFQTVVGPGDYDGSLDQAMDKQKLFGVDLVALGTKKDQKIAAQYPEAKGKGESAVWAKDPALAALNAGKPYSGIHVEDDKVFQVGAFPIGEIYVVIGQAISPSLLTKLKDITGGEAFLALDGKILTASSETLPRADIEKDLQTYFRFDTMGAEKSDAPSALVPYTLSGKACYVQFGAVPTENRDAKMVYGVIVPAAEATARLSSLSSQVAVIGWIGAAVLVVIGLITSRSVVTQTIYVTQDSKTITGPGA